MLTGSWNWGSGARPTAGIASIFSASRFFKKPSYIILIPFPIEVSCCSEERFSRDFLRFSTKGKNFFATVMIASRFAFRIFCSVCLCKISKSDLRCRYAIWEFFAISSFSLIWLVRFLTWESKSLWADSSSPFCLISSSISSSSGASWVSTSGARFSVFWIFWLLISVIKHYNTNKKT